MKKLRIGLTMRVVEAEYYAEIRDALSHDWPKFMLAVLPDATWMPLPNIGKDILEHAESWMLNGFIITGGNDVSEYPQRDQTEMALIEFALNNDLPIFGVCRGFQIMAHYFGHEVKPCPGHAGTRHMIKLGTEMNIVNSYHGNCGPLEVSTPLIAYAWDSEGRIEAFRHETKPLSAIMWHPERHTVVSEYDRVIVRTLFGLSA